MKHGWFGKVLALVVLAALTLPAAALSEGDVCAAEPLESAVEELEVALGEAAEPLEAVTVAAAEAEVTLAAQKVTLGAGEKFDLKPAGSAGSVAFKTSNSKVAKVSSKGVVTAGKPGRATVTALVGGRAAAECAVTVKNAPGKLTMSKGKATLKVGNTLALKAKLPSGTAANRIAWKSSNKGVATVSGEGVVTAKKAGTATVTATVYNGSKATCKITVKAAPIKVTLDKKELLLVAGETWQLEAAPTADTKLTWSSDDKGVATVGKAGLVTAVGAGVAKITVTTATGHSAACKVTVTYPPYKIAIMTGSEAQGEEEYYAASALARKYPDVVVFDTYPDDFTRKVDTTVSRLVKFAKDPEVKAIVFVQAVDGAAEAFNRIRGKLGRDDILLIAGVPAEAPEDIAEAADIVLANDEIGAGRQVGELAGQWGCDVLVHYSFARHLSYETILAKRDAMKAAAGKYGVKFVQRDCLDPVGEEGLDAARDFILEDVPKVMQKYAGRKVCFYCTNCGLQAVLQRAIVNQPNAYYALPCCPSPYHGFQEAFGLTASYGNINGVIKGVAKYLKAHKALNRFSTWALPVNMSMINAGFEYARAWAEGRTNGKLDKGVLSGCFAGAAGGDIELGVFKDAAGRKYSNYLTIALEPIRFADYAG